MRWGLKLGSALLALMGLAALCTAIAVAAAPVNDEYGARVFLSGPLPIATTGTNEGAGEESGEYPNELEFEPAGHSVWYGWEAENTEWVTISTCGSGFDTLLGVYEGSSLSLLEKVVPGKEGARTDCGPGGQQVTFRAVEGTTYEIRVDGNLSPQPPAAVEGAIAMQIATTPRPANDDFSNAQTVTAESLESGAFYRVDVPGFNWNATKEEGEPAHAGDPGGASVWYSWTAPASGSAHVVATSGAFESPLSGIDDGGLLGVYTGSSVDALTSVGSLGVSSREVALEVSAGTTYEVAVDGRFDGSAGMAVMGQLTFLIYLTVPPADPQLKNPDQTVPLADLTAPETTIGRRDVRPGKRKATFRFSSSEPGGKFLCKLDSRKVAGCNPPKVYSGLGPGSHTFKVRAVDSAGNADPTAATARFSIPRPRPRHR
jgi:hypothetical protein